MSQRNTSPHPPENPSWWRPLWRPRWLDRALARLATRLSRAPRPAAPETKARITRLDAGAGRPKRGVPRA